jgi:hypothetical protein
MFPHPSLIGPDGQLDSSGPIDRTLPPEPPDVALPPWNVAEGLAALLLLPALLWMLAF